MDLAGLVVAGISALGTLVQAFYAAKADRTQVDNKLISKADKRANEPLKIGAKQVANVIDDELLAALNGEIEYHVNALIAALRSPVLSEREKEVKVEAARGQICRVLSQIKQFNNDELPTKRLAKLWLSNRCKK